MQMPVTKRRMSKVREETYKEEELRRTLEEINRDARGGYRDKKSRDGKSSTDRGANKDDRRRREEGRSRRKEEEEEERRPRDRDEEKREDRRRHRDDKDDRRRHKDDRDDDRRRHREDADDRRRSKDDGGDRRRHRDDADGKRRHREDGDDRRRSKDDGGDRRRHRDEADEKRRHRDEKGDEKKHRREEKDDRRRHKDEKEEKSRHRDEGEEKRRHRDDKDDRRRHRDKEETEEEREKRKREERRKRREEEEGDERRRRKDREETDEEREKRKREERRKKKEEEERKKREEEEKRRREEMARKVLQDKEEEDNYGDDYEDDFENYDDDFENDESSSGTVNEKNKEMADILRAMSAENDRLSSAKNGRRDSPSSSTSGEVIPADRRQHSGQQKYFINFVSARTRQVDAAVSSRTRQRSRELLRLIHLDSTTHDMFEMGELEAYELYIRGCGHTAANQVACQTNDDAMEREVQCEPIERRTLWTLHPPDELNAVGFAASSAEEAQSRRRGSLGKLRSLQDQLAEEEAERARESEARQVLRSASLQQSMRVMLRLLEEETRPLVAAPPDGGCAQLSSGYSALACPPELRHLPCRFAAFSPSQTNLLLTLHSYGVSGKAGPAERDVGYALVWNVTVPQEPQEVLEAPARATCAVFSPLSASLVFLGLVDGALAVWDLREPPAWHPTDAKGRRRRAAAYSTALVHVETNHQAPVVDLRALSSAAPPPASSTFQLASLDAGGVVLLWVTTQLAAADPAGSEADFGLRPGGRVRLSRTAELRPGRPGAFQSLAFAPSRESGAFLVGSELGEVHHVGRRGARLCPRLFRPAAAAAAAVVSLDLSPFREPFFLAGYADGAVRIFHCSHAAPLLEFVDFGAEAGLAEVRWSRSRPAVFFALDGAGGLFTWDLTRDEHRPVHRERPGGGGGERKALRMALSCDFSATREGSRGRRPQAAFVFSGGGGGDFLEVHELAEALCVGDLDETFRVANLLNSFV